MVDFRTRSTSSAPSTKTIGHAIQLNLYAMAIYAELRELPTEAVYLFLKETRYIPYTPTTETVRAFRNRLYLLVGGVLCGEFPPRRAFDCRWCDYRDLCDSEAGVRSGAGTVFTMMAEPSFGLRADGGRRGGE